MENDIPVISNFKELMNQVGFSWDWPKHSIIKTPEGYVLNKLYITPEYVTYKTDTWELEPGVYEQFERFVGFINSTERHEVSHY